MHEGSGAVARMAVVGAALLAGCAPIEPRNDSAHLESRSAEVVVIAEGNPGDYNFDFVATTLDGQRYPAQVFTDRRRTYLLWPARNPITKLRTAHGEGVDFSREGQYWVVPRIELLWFVETQRGTTMCVRALTMNPSVCQPESETAEREPTRLELMEKRDYLEARRQQILQALENKGRD